MPIKIPKDLPAAKTLSDENIFIMDEQRAFQQDIRPIKIVVVNLTPATSSTEIQLLQMLGSMSLQINVTIIPLPPSASPRLSTEGLAFLYKSFDDIKYDYFDGLIIAGAPAESTPSEDADVWPELAEIMEWSNHNVYSTLHICQGAWQGLYHRYGIASHTPEQKLSGIFPHHCPFPCHQLVRGFDDVYYTLYSNHSLFRAEDVAVVKDLRVLSLSNEAGAHIIASNNCRNIFVTSYWEYSRSSLSRENSAPSTPVVNWRSHSQLLFANWINFVIYQNTPYDLTSLDKCCLKLRA